MTPPLESELAAGMRDAVAGLRTERDLFGSALADHRRSTVRRRISATGGVALVAAAVIGVAMFVSADATAPDVATVLNAAAVTQRTTDALETDLIRHATKRITGWPTEGQITEQWYDPRTGDTLTHTSGGGADVEDVRWNRNKPGVYVMVNRTDRTWWSQDKQYDGPPIPEQHAPPPETAAQIRAALDDGRNIQVVGNEQVNGHATIHLRMVLTRTDEPSSIIGEPRYDLWVDEKTFLPVRSLLTIWVEANPKYFPGGKDETTEAHDYEWLPRTEENLAALTLTVPAGYTEEPPFQIYTTGPDGSATPVPSR
ncbi:hypothetical protein [Cryptosporangium minutisporangium]|uniref:Uncharacterized protein n=1 Tax=Cryptosporangium minutisporangium TaxID=113569 RepID=A0ABP6T4L4_9ACTN